MNMYLLEFRATSIGIGFWVTQELNQLEFNNKKKIQCSHLPHIKGGWGSS